MFVTGSSYGAALDSDYATVAYDASTGARLWAKRYQGLANPSDSANAVGVSPDGSRVFVTGVISGSNVVDWATVAYDASTGAQLWVRRYHGPGGFSNVATALGVSPDGSRLFVAGFISMSRSQDDYATVAYDTSTGARLWAKRYHGPAVGGNGASALGVSPDGSQVFVTGSSTGTTNNDYATLAYDASTGAKLWVKRYNGPADSYDSASALGVSPDGSQVFVTGSSPGLTSDYDYATVAYDASTGAKLWLKRYNGTGNFTDLPSALGVSPDGSGVFVTGESAGSSGKYHYATVAYNADPGTQPS